MAILFLFILAAAFLGYRYFSQLTSFISNFNSSANPVDNNAEENETTDADIEAPNENQENETEKVRGANTDQKSISPDTVSAEEIFLGTSRDTAPVADLIRPATQPNAIQGPAQGAPDPIKQLTSDEEIAIKYVNRIISTFNHYVEAVNIQSLSSCISSTTTAANNLTTCRTIAKHGTDMIASIENEVEDMINQGPLTITNHDLIDQESINKSIYVHSAAFRIYLSHSELMYRAADELFKLIEKDVEIYRKNPDVLTEEESADIQEQLPIIDNARQVAQEALKMFSELELLL